MIMITTTAAMTIAATIGIIIHNFCLMLHLVGGETLFLISFMFVTSVFVGVSKPSGLPGLDLPEVSGILLKFRVLPILCEIIFYFWYIYFNKKI